MTTAITPTSGERDWALCLAKAEQKALRIVRDPEEAKNIAQDVVVKALTKLKSGGRLEEGWFIQTARFLSLDHLRRKKRFRKWLDRAMDGGFVERVSASELVARLPPHWRIPGALAMLELFELLAQLKPPEQREAIRLIYLEGLSFEEAAKKMGCAHDTAKTRVFRGLEKLRGRLENLGLMDILKERLR
jgi:RNA polymerase sigma-70 factor (ECF subfamily)